MFGDDVAYLLVGCLPISFADGLEHNGSDFLHSSRVLLFEKLFDAEVEFVFYVYVVNLVPQFVVDSRRLHHVPSVRIAYCLGKDGSRRGFAFHLLFDISGVEYSRTSLYADSLFDLLHPYIATVAVVAQVSVGVFARNVACRQVDASHKLIDVVEAESSPSIALARLYHHIGACESRTESKFSELLPIFLATVESTHIIDVSIGYLRLFLPTVAALYHTLYTCAVVAVKSAEDAVRGNLFGFFWRQSVVEQRTLCFGYSLCHKVVVLVVFGFGSHLYCPIDEK